MGNYEAAVNIIHANFCECAQDCEIRRASRESFEAAARTASDSQNRHEPKANTPANAKAHFVRETTISFIPHMIREKLAVIDAARAWWEADDDDTSALEQAVQALAASEEK